MNLGSQIVNNDFGKTIPPGVFWGLLSSVCRELHFRRSGLHLAGIVLCNTI